MTVINVGYDASGNGNNWTTNNIDQNTSGTGADVLVDVPTLWGTDTGTGGEVRGNYCTFNAVAKTSNVTLTNGNLDAAFGTVSGGGGVIATIAPSSGKWYWEVTVTAASSAAIHIGVLSSALTTFGGTQYYEPGLTADGYAYQNDGTKYNNNTNTSYGASYTTGNTIGVALDLDAGTIAFYKDGSSQGTAFTGLSGAYFPAVGDGSSAGTHSVTANFGQRPFAYTAPSGFAALCTTNLPASTILDGDQHFNAVLYTGNGTSQTIDTGLQPDFIWIKRRDGAAAHTLTDSVRGTSKQLFTNLTDAEQTDSDSGVTAISSSSMTLGDNNLAVGSVNGSGSTYVAWNWKANGAGVTNTAGTISSTVSANTTAGFSIVTYTGNATANQTVGHGLGVAPSMIIVKNRTTSGASWATYHASVGIGKYLELNKTDAPTTNSAFFDQVTSTVFGFDAGGLFINSSGDNYVAYCFAPIAGYSAFGSFVGSGSADGPMIFCNFRPRYVLIKRSTGVDNWFVYDTARSTYNLASQTLQPNTSNAEDTTVNQIDILSNGFKCRSSNTATNQSSETYIYACFAENPFKYALAR